MTSIDPYQEFEEWCKANGYADLIECEIEETDTDRLYEAVVTYGASSDD
jgi:hypothetical protein